MLIYYNPYIHYIAKNTWHQHQSTKWTQISMIKTNIMIALLCSVQCVCADKLHKNIAQRQICGRWHWPIYRRTPTVVSPCCWLKYIPVSDLHLKRTSKYWSKVNITPLGPFNATLKLIIWTSSATNFSKTGAVAGGGGGGWTCSQPKVWGK